MSSPPEHTARSARQDEYRHCAPLLVELAGLPEDDARHEPLRARLVTEYLPVAEHIARRFTGRGEARDDLVQVARIGLIHAIDRFQPDRGSDFLSFAVPTIMGEVRRHFRDSAWSLRVPRRLKELHLSLSQATSVLSQRVGRAPTPSELAAHLGLTVEEVSEGLIAGNAYQTMSVDKAVTGESDTMSLADTLGEDDTELEHVENHEALLPLLRELPHRERSIVVMRFFGNLTQTQIAERVGISQMHVSRLLSQTLQELRAKLTADE
ncbi:SigB/SigF/SigG family RNA polymerase sigma factor [Amycolatopsis sp. H20-H5]|uniref:SigB/SigF/SigG family RNA polymerase sigma factor n=1 Tax=Amycolatopsis sp. H20-H5 TaxID=3046309 RepID=UPI002DB5962D|nr:SigB/SigF/SigG family RNA polymerase sigma factor [Amycolatopsis sp. H20-H5]MEC3976709.1 SigB/SigF/SigG family RNA polymerase sigma factor [Amycolatopsis sp. H20-H5]